MVLFLAIPQIAVLLEMLNCACHDWLWLENNDSSEKRVRSSDAAKRSIAKPNS